MRQIALDPVLRSLNRHFGDWNGFSAYTEGSPTANNQTHGFDDAPLPQLQLHLPRNQHAFVNIMMQDSTESVLGKPGIVESKSIPQWHHRWYRDAPSLFVQLSQGIEPQSEDLTL